MAHAIDAYRLYDISLQCHDKVTSQWNTYVINLMCDLKPQFHTQQFKALFGYDGIQQCPFASQKPTIRVGYGTWLHQRCAELVTTITCQAFKHDTYTCTGFQSFVQMLYTIAREFRTPAAARAFQYLVIRATLLGGKNSSAGLLPTDAEVAAYRGRIGTYY